MIRTKLNDSSETREKIMTEKELRHLSKTEMLEIMLKQETEVNALKDRIQELNFKLSERSILISEAGSIAEASLIINKVMDAAQQAADQYLDNIKSLSEKQSYAFQQIQSEAQAKAASVIREAENQCAQREQQEKDYIDALWISLQKKLDDYYAAKPGLKEALAKDAVAADVFRCISAEQLRENRRSGVQ